MYACARHCAYARIGMSVPRCPLVRMTAAAPSAYPYGVDVRLGGGGACVPGGQIWADVVSGRAVAHPWLLTRFLLLTYADLKKFKYTYWFAFPALSPAAPFAATSTAAVGARLSAAQQSAVRTSYEALRHGDDGNGDAAFFLVVVGSDDGAGTRVATLSEHAALSAAGATVWLGFADPCGLPTHPGWPLRNLLVLARVQWRTHRATVLCLRENPGKEDISRSLVLDVVLGDSADLDGNPCSVAPRGAAST
jgi:ubiquitin-like modifier-activating enzyme ATG7